MLPLLSPMPPWPAPPRPVVSGPCWPGVNPEAPGSPDLLPFSCIRWPGTSAAAPGWAGTDPLSCMRCPGAFSCDRLCAWPNEVVAISRPDAAMIDNSLAFMLVGSFCCIAVANHRTPFANGRSTPRHLESQRRAVYGVPPPLPRFAVCLAVNRELLIADGPGTVQNPAQRAWVPATKPRSPTGAASNNQGGTHQ